MKHLFLFLSLPISAPVFSAGPCLGTVDNVVVTQTGVDEKDPFSNSCNDFSLSATKAMTFMNKATIVTQREVHDYYEILPCFVRGTAIIHGYPAEWEIRAGGTGSITLMSGEYLPIVDEAERNEPDQPKH